MRTMLLILIAALTAGFCESTVANAPCQGKGCYKRQYYSAWTYSEERKRHECNYYYLPTAVSKQYQFMQVVYVPSTSENYAKFYDPAKRDWVLRIPMPGPEAQAPEGAPVARIWEVKTSTGWQPDAAVRRAPIDTGEPIPYPTIPDPQFAP